MTVVLCAALLACGAAFSEDVAKPAAGRDGKYTNFVSWAGGMVAIPAKGPAAVFLDAQGVVGVAVAEETAREVGRKTGLPAESRRAGAAEAEAEAARLLGETNRVAAVVLLVERPGDPALLVAPEARWARVNVAALGEGEARAGRAAKEMWRAYGFLMGAADSNYPKSLMRPVRAPEDLDALLPGAICHEGTVRIQRRAEAEGAVPARRVPYRKAIEEGWALPPTNALQKAVWDEVRGVGPAGDGQ